MEKRLWKKGMVLGIILLFVGASAVPTLGMSKNKISNQSQMGRATLYVGGSGPGNYSTIQGAIDNASSGDTVYVYNGTYYENVVINQDNINLIGEDKDTTIIDANGGLNAVTINTCSNVLVECFSIRNASGTHPEGNGIKIYSNGNCNYNTISDCSVYDNDHDGILISVQKHMNARYNKIVNCELYNNGFDGFSMQAYDSPFNLDANQIWNSKCYNNSRYGIFSAGVIYGTHHIISDCETYNNGVGGIYINSYESQILNTSSYQNGGHGMCLMNADNGLITNCTFYNNTNEGINSSYTTPNNVLIYRNNFINNNPNAYDTNNEIWYNATIQEGNYYDDYTGEDNNGDGIGDTPYNISGGSNQDLYPLMYPWYPTHPDTVYVDDDYDNSTPGWGYDKFNKIQYGVNEVEGSTVYVYNGTYYENIIVDKTINLVGEDRKSTIINGSSGTGITVNITANSLNLSGFTIENIWAYGDVGIWIYSDNNIISGNILLGHGDDGITVFGNNNIISENVFENNADGIGLGDYCSNNTVYGNIISNCTDDGIYGGNNNIISANIIDNNADSGIWLRNKSNNYISGNTIINNYRGVSLKENSKDNTISGNIISQNYRDGIDLQNSNNNSIIGNSISSNNEGIELGYSSNSNTISFNTIFDNWDGIEVHYSCDNNIIQDNNISSNSDDGIDINWSSTDNIIVRNTISNNQVGIHLSDFSDNNSIYHNNFINNTQNAYDECNNTWDNGYPSGGNYWDDYIGDDLYSGPNQDIPGRDGIGDTPYNILGGDNQDMYPCMKPNGWINSPPNVPDRPSGEVIILPGVDYTYTTSTIDPDDDSIWYKWDWGDGTFSDWLGPYDSEEEASESHIWSQGAYEISVKAKDSRNPETDWSEPLPVNVIFPNLKTVFLFGFITNLSKSTDYYSFNVVKLLWIGFNPIFPEILSSNEVIVISDKFFGILRPSFIFGFFKAMILT